MRSLASNQFCTIAQNLGFVNLALSVAHIDFDWNVKFNIDQEFARVDVLLLAVRRFSASVGVNGVI